MGHQEDIVKTESKIIVIRDTQVILDRDVAELYGVTTKVVNQAIRNNPDKFPSGYVIELTNSEKEHVVKNFDHLETLKFSHATVKGFTEQDLFHHNKNSITNGRLSIPEVAYFLFLLPLFKYFFPKTLEVTRKSRIFVPE
jgi:hypothetical protein